MIGAVHRVRLENERSLLARARQLDREALAAIFDAYYDPIFRYIYVRVGHVQATEDLASQVFQRLLDHLREGRGPDQFLKAWLFRVAENLIVDDVRRSRHRIYIPLESENFELSVTPENSDPILLNGLRVALEALSPPQRQAVTLRYLLEFSSDEIAEIMNISVGAAKAHVHRGLSALRGKLSEKTHESE